MPFRPLPAILRDHAKAFPDKVALRFLADGKDGECLTYAELDRGIRILAGCLRGRAKTGDRVLLLLPSGLEYVISFLACLAGGLIAVPAYPPDEERGRHRDRIGGILADATPTLVLTDRQHEPGLAGQPWLTGIPVIAVDSIDPAWEDAWREPTVRPESIAFLQYTSGSTSAPKGVCVTHGNVIANERAIGAAFGMVPDDVVVSWLPLYHDMGLIGGLLQPLYAGLTLILMAPARFLGNPARWLEAIGRYGGTVSGGPDFAFRLCCERISDRTVERLSLASWRLAFSGAEPVRPDTLDAFATRFRAAGFDARSLYPCYGLAEATLLAAGGRRGDGARGVSFDPEALAAGRAEPAADGRVLVSCGEPPEAHAIVVADWRDGEPALADGVGEILVSGPSVADGYWNNSAATDESFVHWHRTRYLRTGDLGFLYRGQVFVTGRRKDVIIVRGQNYYPQDLESVIADGCPAVRRGRVAVFPVADGAGEGIGVAAEVGRGQRKSYSPEHLAESINRVVADEIHQSAAVVLLLNPGALPLTSSGKLRRAACWEGWRDRILDTYAVFDTTALAAMAHRGEADAAPSTETERVVAELWRGVLKCRDVGALDHFFELGGNSIGAAQMTAEAGARFGCDLGPKAVFEAPVLRDFCAEIDRNRDAMASGPAMAVGAAIARVDDRAFYPLSFEQQRLWYLWRLAPDSAAYTVAGVLHLHGALDPDAVGRTLEILAERHEILRTVFAAGDDGVGEQRILPAPAVALEDLGAVSEDEILRRVARPFDLESDPPWRAFLASGQGGDHRRRSRRMCGKACPITWCRNES